ncbi:MAG: hypothetical protein AAF443_06815 [Chlamydiota bacterium]
MSAISGPNEGLGVSIYFNTDQEEEYVPTTRREAGGEVTGSNHDNLTQENQRVKESLLMATQPNLREAVPNQDVKVCIEGRPSLWFLLIRDQFEDKLKEFSRQYPLESYVKECREKFAAQRQLTEELRPWKNQRPISVRFEGKEGKTKTEIFSLYLLLNRMALNLKKEAASDPWETKKYSCPLLAIYKMEKSLGFEVRGKDLLIQESLALTKILDFCLKASEYSDSLDEFYWDVLLPNMRNVLLNLEGELDQKGFEKEMKKVTSSIFCPDTLSKLSEPFDEKPLPSSVLLPLLANYIDLSNIKEGFDVFYKFKPLERVAKWVELHCEAVKYVPPEKGREILEDATNYVNEKIDPKKVGATIHVMRYLWTPEQRNKWNTAKDTALSLIEQTRNSLNKDD